MFGDTPFSPELVLSGPEPAFGESTAGTEEVVFLGQQSPTPQSLQAYDQWGAIRIPTSSGIVFVPQATQPNGTSMWVAPADVPVGDPCLAVILDFLATFFNTDGNAIAAWQAVCREPKSQYPLTRVFAHDPREVTVNATHFPALYLWRSGGEPFRRADDWFSSNTKLMGFWVFASAQQRNQQIRSTFGNVLEKLLTVAIERGRTPGWRQPDDVDPTSAKYGTLFYPYAGFETFTFDRHRPAKLTLVGSSKTDPVADYSAIELTFSLSEKLDYGLGRFDPLMGTFDSIQNPQGQTVVSGFLDD